MNLSSIILKSSKFDKFLKKRDLKIKLIKQNRFDLLKKIGIILVQPI